MIETNNRLELLKRLIHRNDFYAQQEDNGDGYYSIPKKLTNDVLSHHLEGSITIGAYELAPDNTVLWGCLDHDEDTLDDYDSAINEFALLKEQRYGSIL